MAKIKTTELTGAALDWAVAKCEGVALEHFSHKYGCIVSHNCDATIPTAPGYGFCPSTNWAQGGPIIESEYLQPAYQSNGKRKGEWGCVRWIIDHSGATVPIQAYGDSLLTAAMRCYVASKLGDTVEVPGELQ